MPFDQSGLGGIAADAVTTQPGPDLHERLDGRRAREPLPVTQRNAVIRRLGFDPHRGHVEYVPLVKLHQHDRTDRDALHAILISEGSLFLDLEREALVNAVGNKRTHRREGLFAPCVLDFHECRVDALTHLANVELGIGGGHGGGGLPDAVFVGGVASPADDAPLIRRQSLLVTVVNNHERDKRDGKSDVRIFDAEPDPEIDQPADAAAAPASTTASTIIPPAAVPLAATGSGQCAGRVAKPCGHRHDRNDKLQRPRQPAPNPADSRALVVALIHAITH